MLLKLNCGPECVLGDLGIECLFLKAAWGWGRETLNLQPEMEGHLVTCMRFPSLRDQKKFLRWSLPFLANVSFPFISPLVLFFPLPPHLVCPLPSASPTVLWPPNLEGFFSVCPGLDPGNALGQPRGGSPGARLYSECRAPLCWVPWVWDSPWFHQWFQSLPGPLLLSKPAQPVCWLGCLCVKQTVPGKQREDLGAFIRKADALACH